MKLDYALQTNSATIAGRLAWSPARLFAKGQRGAYFSARRGLFQDAAGTLPASNPRDPVALWQDLSGCGNHAVQPIMEQRPILGRHPARGLMNRLPNNTSDGAALGVLGAGGALPDGWTLAGMPAGTVEILSIAPKNGRPNIRLRLNGTPTGTVFMNTVGAQDFIQAAVGQTWNSSAWIQRVAGSTNNLTNLAFTLFSFDGNTPSGGSLGPDLRDVIDTDTRRSTPFQITNASVDRVTQYLRLAATGTIDITLDVSAPQLEQGSQPSGLQLARANGFDVTEAGQSSLWYLQPDGVDDWMQFTPPLQCRRWIFSCGRSRRSRQSGFRRDHISSRHDAIPDTCGRGCRVTTAQRHQRVGITRGG